MFQISHPWHSEGRESCKEGTQVRPLGNGNCKNNSSDCNQLTVSLQPSLESLGQPARQSSSQEEGADRKPWWGNTAFQARNGDGDLPCSASLELHLNMLICGTLPKKHCSPERAQISVCQADGPTPSYIFFILGVKQGSIIQVKTKKLPYLAGCI